MNPKQKQWSQELYERASEFHGHGGPFMVIGLRMGLRALNTFNSEGWFGLNCVTTLRWSPPESCVLDGIQSSSGCTMGKKNISVKEGKGVSAMFQSGSKRLQITLRPEVYKEIKQAMSPEAEQTKPDHENKSLVKHLIDAKDEELFIITIQQ